MAYDNSRAIDAGEKKLQKAIYEYFLRYVEDYCMALFASADAAREYRNLTGNTFTSYACGIYRDGALKDVLLSADYKRPPVRVKLQKGEVFDGDTYDGNRAVFKATADTDGGYGRDTSLRFLRQYRPKVMKGFEVVMCTGTEYSTVLESRKGLNVLTNTFLYSRAIFFRNLKRMA
jgi:hypothetical protein